MFVLSWVCCAIAAAYVWRWLRRSPDKNPLEDRFPALELLVLGAVAAAAWWPTWQADRAARKAGAVMSALAGQPLAYTCGSQLGTFFDRDTDFAYGYVRWNELGPEKRSKLRHESCDGLVEFLKNPSALPGPRRRARVIAVHVVSHEARHMLGEMNEAKADCQALQRNAQVAQALGAPVATARELALAYWQEVYPAMPAPYNSPECRPGGALDENLPTSPWNLH